MKLLSNRSIYCAYFSRSRVESRSQGRLQGLSTASRRKYVKFLHSPPSRDAETGSTVEPAFARRVNHGTCRCTTTGAQHHTKNLDLWNSTVLCTVCTVHRQRGTNWNVHHSVEEMNQPSPRTHTTWIAGPQQEPGLLELVKQRHRDVNQSPKEAARWCGRAESHQPQRATSRTPAPSGPTVAPTTSRSTPHTQPP